MTPRDVILESYFQVAYNMGGGVLMDNLKHYLKKDFLFLLKRLRQQKIDENKAIESAVEKGKSSKTSSGKMKYLGR